MTLALVAGSLIAVLAINIFLLPGVRLITSLYAIPILVAALRWPPKAIALVAVITIAGYVVEATFASQTMEGRTLTVLTLATIAALACLLGLQREQTALRAHEADITRERAQFLAQLSAALGSSLDYEATLQEVARQCVPWFADWCTVYMMGNDGQVRRVAVAYDDESKAEVVQQLSRYKPSPVSPNSSVAEAMRTGAPVLTEHIPASYVESIAQDAEHLALMRRLDFKSSLTVPLRARGEVFGALAFFLSSSDRRYESSDLAAAADLGRRAGMAVDNARLYGESQQAIRARDEFLSVVSHELRTPITSLVGFAQLARKQLDGAGQIDTLLTERALGAIDRQSARLALLVSRLLEVSRLDGGALALDHRSTDVVPLVAGIVSGARIRTEQHTFELHAPDRLRATIDPIRFEQVITNLIDNAVKYSPNGGAVEVTIGKPRTGVAEIAVRDHGVGIPPEQRDHIFERYFRAHAQDHASGMGLGLYISREIVVRHGGEIRCEFPADGGSRFVVALPIDAATPIKAAPIDAATERKPR